MEDIALIAQSQTEDVALLQRTGCRLHQRCLERCVNQLEGQRVRSGEDIETVFVRRLRLPVRHQARYHASGSGDISEQCSINFGTTLA